VSDSDVIAIVEVDLQKMRLHFVLARDAIRERIQQLECPKRPSREFPDPNIGFRLNRTEDSGRFHDRNNVNIGDPRPRGRTILQRIAGGVLPQCRSALVGTKLFRTLSRVIPHCGMVSQAVAFNMFLAFFPILLVALGLISGSLRGTGGPQLAVQLSAILPPGSWQLVSEPLVRRGGNPWTWVLLGWFGTLLAGSQVMKLIMEGIRIVYGDDRRHPFLDRQLRSLSLFCLSIMAWLLAVALSIFRLSWREWVTHAYRQSRVARGVLIVMLPVLSIILAMLVLALIYRVARPSATTWRSVLPGAAVATTLWWGVNMLFETCVRYAQYGPIYGGLTAAIGLMVWMELSAMIVLLGAAWNAENAVRDGLAAIMPDKTPSREFVPPLWPTGGCSAARQGFGKKPIP
jgi:membrane protein